MDESEIPTYQILKQAHFDQELRLADRGTGPLSVALAELAGARGVARQL